MFRRKLSTCSNAIAKVHARSPKGSQKWEDEGKKSSKIMVTAEHRAQLSDLIRAVRVNGNQLTDSYSKA